MFVTITFRSFTPTPGGLEFKPGKDYYFITTSSQNNLHNKIGGRCVSHGMKVIFKVIDNSIPRRSEKVNLLKNKKHKHKRKKYGIKPEYIEDNLNFKRFSNQNENKTYSKLEGIKFIQANSHIYGSSYQTHPQKNKKYPKFRENEVLEYEEISVEASRMHASGSSSIAMKCFVIPKTFSIVLYMITMYFQPL